MEIRPLDHRVVAEGTPGHSVLQIPWRLRPPWDTASYSNHPCKLQKQHKTDKSKDALSKKKKRVTPAMRPERLFCPPRRGLSHPLSESACTRSKPKSLRCSPLAVQETHGGVRNQIYPLRFKPPRKTSASGKSRQHSVISGYRTSRSTNLGPALPRAI